MRDSAGGYTASSSQVAISAELVRSDNEGYSAVGGVTVSVISGVTGGGCCTAEAGVSTLESTAWGAALHNQASKSSGSLSVVAASLCVIVYVLNNYYK